LEGEGIFESLSRESEEVKIVEIFVDVEEEEQHEVEGGVAQGEEQFEDDEIFDWDADFDEKVLILDLLIFFGSSFVLTIESWG
jgi:hypothetical protein